MTESTALALDATEVLHPAAGEAYRVIEGTVLLFAVSQQAGRRLPVTELKTGEILIGAELPGADLLAVGLPGTRVQACPPPEPAQVARMRQAAIAALEADQATARAAERAAKLAGRHEQHLLEDAMLSLATAVPGTAASLLNADAPIEVVAVDFVARQIGLRPNPLSLRRALADVEVTGRDPVNALAGAAGAAVRRVELPPDWWRKEGPPLLLRSAQGEVAVALWHRGACQLWRPGLGFTGRVSADAVQKWAYEAILLEPLLDPSRPATVGQLLRLGIRGNSNSLWLVVGLTGVLGLLAAVIPLVSGSLTNTVANQQPSTLLLVAIALALFAAGSMALQAVRLFALSRVRGRGVAVAATAVWDRMLRLPMTWHNQRTVSSRLGDANSVDAASMALPDSVLTALLDVAVTLGAVTGVFVVSPQLGVAVVAFLGLRAMVDVLLVRRGAQLAKAAGDTNSAARSVTLAVIGGVNRLRVSGASGRGFALWAKAAARAAQVNVRQRWLQVTQQMAGAIWPALGLGVLLVVAQSSAASVGELVTAQTALAAATAALAAAVSSVGAALTARELLKDAADVLAGEPESGTGQEIAELVGAIDLRDVVFGYAEDVPPVLKGVSLSIPAGANVAIVGPSGCGKSTLLRLLLGLEDPDSGIVSFDGRDITALDRSAVRRQIGAVMQSSALIPGNIRDNVDLGRGFTASQVWQALADAAVAEDVRTMPMGLSTVIVEGAGTISGGQRQRILLARALIGRPRVLVLDEATSAMDNLSQAAVVASLDRLNVTRVMVAHRLSTIESADLVIMLSDGVVVDQGAYAELAHRPGPFAELVVRQRL